MSVNKKLIGATSAFALACGLVACGDSEISADTAFCQIDESAKYPVQIISAFDGALMREGTEKAFPVDREAGTCSVPQDNKSGSYFIYQLKH
ncbi:hypothetical protein [Micavibrio aeruginosavorus]|uniref:Lipoprotein n=1 Tax=Micavibrio aeruginosavorus EPB TaxID=349215 RepID=M4VGJ0_9BACT|nr:hypothetical protein [Micavibrio aeruginosavorus]AGH98467.1 hypothetical protein A11S_1663 [Micavibrio aeruginosavorus EPB]